MQTDSGENRQSVDEEVVSESSSLESSADSVWSLCMDDSVTESDSEDDHRCKPGNGVPHRRETIRKDHWKRKKHTKQCTGCEKMMNILQRKHHCRICGDVFCYHCTRKTRRLTPNIVPDPDAKKYKVCKVCYENVCCDESDDGQTRSRTLEFHSLWLETKANRTDPEDEPGVTQDAPRERGSEIDSRGILRIMSIRGKLLDAFDNDMRKSTTDTMLEKGRKVAKKGKFFRFFKKQKRKPEPTATEHEEDTPEITLCEDCQTNLNIDGVSHDCLTCGKIFCDDCCDKRVQVSFSSRNSVVIKEPSIDIDSLLTEVTDTGQRHKRYRVCRFCRQEYLRECFLREVSSTTQIMIQIQKEIMSSDDDDPEVPVITQEYIQYYRKLVALQTHSMSQTRLKQNVQNAMREFHINMISQRSIKRTATQSTSEKAQDDPCMQQDDAVSVSNCEQTLLQADVHSVRQTSGEENFQLTASA